MTPRRSLKLLIFFAVGIIALFALRRGRSFRALQGNVVSARPTTGDIACVKACPVHIHNSLFTWNSPNT
jgi:hypothetical protein